MRAAIYARVSSAQQREAQSIDSQLAVLRPLVVARGRTLTGEYLDDGKSARTGKLAKRDAFARLLADAEAHHFDELYVFDVDRLTRTEDMRERADILGPFQRAGITIVTPSGEIRLDTMTGELHAIMKALVAAEENRSRSARVKAGRIRAAAEGRKPAGPTPFGLSYSRAAGWSLDEPAAVTVREIVERVKGGESCQRIADDLAERDVRPAPRAGWTRATVYHLVQRRTIAGEVTTNASRGETIAVPAIVTVDQWQAAQRALIDGRLRGLARTQHLYLLDGLCVCARCEARIGIRSGNERCRTSAAYVCPSRRDRHGCDQPALRVDAIDARVWSAASEELLREDLLERLAALVADRASEARDWRSDARAYRAHATRLDRVEEQLLARLRRGTISEGALDRELAKLGRERDAVRLQLETAERQAAGGDDVEQRLESAASLLASVRDAIPAMEPGDRRALLRELVAPGGVRLDGERIELDLAFDASRLAPSGASDPRCRIRQVSRLPTMRIRRAA